MSEFRISHMCRRSSGSNLLSQYRILEEYMTKYLGKNIIINEVSLLEESQRKEIEELKVMIQEATPWLMNNKYLPYNEIKSWLEKAEKIK